MSALRQPTSTLASRQVFHGVRLAVPAFAAGSRGSAAQRRQERHAHTGKCQAVYTADTQVRHRTPTFGGPTARVTFKIPRALPFGQVLKLVGSHAELGDWEWSDAPVMNWSEGDMWLLAADLPAGDHEFKLAAVAVGANGDETVVEWEQGPNRKLKVPTAEAKINGSFSVQLEWGNPNPVALPQGQLLAGSNWQHQNGNSNGHDENHNNHNNHSHNHNGHRQEWSVEAERDALRGERDSLAHQLVHAQDALAAALAEKAQLEAAAQRAQHNIDVLRQVGQLLRTMHTD